MILWTTNYYDGPISGICVRNRRIYYFAWDTGYDSPDKPRRFGIYWMTRDEVEHEFLKHFDFENSAGTHCCLHLPPDKRKVAEEVDHDFWKRWPLEDQPSYTDTRQPIEVIDEDELAKNGY